MTQTSFQTSFFQVSVTRDYGPALQRWDESSAREAESKESKESKEKPSLGDRIASLLSLRRRNTVRDAGREKSRQVRRSQSMVTQSKKKPGEY